MESSILISVLIPVFNSEKYIRQCIDNLTCQTYKKLEIIFIDDGSDDTTADIIKQYDVKYIYQKNRGVYAARNLGLENALGDYIHFLDVDDLINVDFYEQMLLSALQTDSDVACCGFVFERFKSQSQLFDYKILAVDIEDKITLTNVHVYGACWRYLFKRNFLNENNLRFEDGRAAFDRVFSLKAVYYANKVVSVPQSIYIYKNRPHSITTSKSVSDIRRRHADRKIAIRYLEDFANEHNFSLLIKRNESWSYSVFGLPIISKQILHVGKIKWYFLGIVVFKKIERGI